MLVDRGRSFVNEYHISVCFMETCCALCTCTSNRSRHEVLNANSIFQIKSIHVHVL